jgi:hypothetical protein
VFFRAAEPAARPGIETRRQLVGALREGATIEVGRVAGLGQPFQ